MMLERPLNNVDYFVFIEWYRGLRSEDLESRFSKQILTMFAWVVGTAPDAWKMELT
jgi:hypothetical protein